MMIIRPVNPYVAGAPLRGEQGFFGRQDTLDWVAQELRNPATNALVLFGQRRIGKTTFLLQLQRALPADAFLPVYFDLQDQTARPLSQVLADLADIFAEQTGMKPPSPDAFDAEGRFFRRTFLPQLYAVLGENRRPVLLLDEFDVMDQVSEAELMQTAAAKALFPFLHRVMAEDLRLAFVFTVGRRAEDLSLDFIATFKASLVREIWVLDWESAGALVCQAETNGTLRFTDRAVERILGLTSGHPYLTQLLCQRIWERAYTKNLTVPPIVDVSEVESAVPNALEAGGHALIWLWNGLSPAEKIYAAALAEIAAEGQTIAEDSVIQVLAAHAARLRRREIEVAPQDLVKRRVLEQVGDREYRFAVELFCRWIRQNKHLREVKDELDRIEPFAERLYEIGKGYLGQRQWQDAIRYFRDALQSNSHHFRARLQLGEALLELGQIDESVNELKQAYEQDRQEVLYALVRALVIQARAREEAGDENGALVACEQALEVSPNERAAQELRISIWTRQGDTALAQDNLDEALILYRKAGNTERIAQVEILQQKQELAALEAQAQAHERAEQWIEAIDVLEKIVSIDRTYLNSYARLVWARAQHKLQSLNTADALYNQGIECFRRDSWEEATATFRKLVRIAPGYKDAEEKLREAQRKARESEDIEDLYRMGKAYFDQAQWEAAIVYLKRIVESREKYRDTAVLLDEAKKQLSLEILYTNAEALLKGMKWAEAIETLEEILRIDPNYRDSHNKFKQAQNQRRLQNLYERAMIHIREESWMQAVSDLRRIYEVDPGYLDVFQLLQEAEKQATLAHLYMTGVDLQEAGRWEEAIDRFAEIISLGRVYRDVATRLAQVQRQHELTKWLEEGEDFLRQEEWREAVEAFERVYKTAPNYGGVRIKLRRARKQLHLAEKPSKRPETGPRGKKWPAKWLLALFMLSFVSSLVVVFYFARSFRCLLAYYITESQGVLIIAFVGGAAAILNRFLPDSAKQPLQCVLGGIIVALLMILVVTVFIPPPPKEECFPTPIVTVAPTPMYTPMPVSINISATTYPDTISDTNAKIDLWEPDDTERRSREK